MSGMMIKKILEYLPIALIFLFLTQCSNNPKNSNKHPNIILCMADDQGWGDMAYNGHPVLQTPNFDAMAAEENRIIYDDQPENLQHFYGEITGMDTAFGKLREELKTLSDYKNTLLWYCSDNGGLPGLGSTGGRGNKGDVYEGGLRVPALLEWPARVVEPGVTNFPSNTSDIFPTLLEIAGIKADADRPLDGISLLPVLDKRMESRTRPMGFWQYPVAGIPTPSAVWMAELLEAQKNGSMVGDSSRLRLEDIQIRTRYPVDTLAGHAAWLDWPWKVHRIQDEAGDIRWELYRLDNDPLESKDLSGDEPDRAAEMGTALEKWQRSVVRSMYGLDYI
jgi:arylsulfatase A-like enzyme